MNFQSRVKEWVTQLYANKDIDSLERNHRFLEECLELAQACACTAEEAHKLVDYVFSRPIGDIASEVGGTMTTLASLCTAHKVDMILCAEQELIKNWNRINVIRAKNANKPKFSPLPGQYNEDHN